MNAMQKYLLQLVGLALTLGVSSLLAPMFNFIPGYTLQVMEFVLFAIWELLLLAFKAL